MDVSKLSKTIVEKLEESVEYDKYDILVSDIIWAEFRDFFNAVWKMRKCQNVYFKTRKTSDLNTAKEYEKKLDRLLTDLYNQKYQPKLKV